MARPPAAPAAPQQAPLGPGDIPGLFECLQGALQPATQKQCEAVLLGLEQRPGYSSCLLVTFTPSSAIRLPAPEATRNSRQLTSPVFKEQTFVTDNADLLWHCNASSTACEAHRGSLDRSGIRQIKADQFHENPCAEVVASTPAGDHCGAGGGRERPLPGAHAAQALRVQKLAPAPGWIVRA